jgi:Flp pilus assembly pilin Flp
VTSPAVRIWYALLISFIACVVVAGASVFYAGTVQAESERRWRDQQRQSDQRWCKLFVQLTDSQDKTPPTSESGKQFAAELTRLRGEFGCG